MSTLVADCPRCGANQITFDLLSEIRVNFVHGWQNWLEVFCRCRNCRLPTIFLVKQKSVEGKTAINNGLSKLAYTANSVVKVERFIGLQDNNGAIPPDHLPERIEVAFKEGAACLAIGCNNAAATMFRLCLDLATKSLLPEQAEGLNSRVSRNLGLRLTWLFDNNLLPAALRDLSSCIKDDGNDGAHEGILSAEDTNDILDFTSILLERMYTEPKRLQLAAQRRLARRQNEEGR